jgi:putative transposase
MDKQQPIVPADFFKQFKNKVEFQSFFNQLFKQGVDEMLRGELDEHLGYTKHSPEGRKKCNSRYGSYIKTVKSERLGDVILAIPRDRDGQFSPQLVHKGKRMSDKLEMVIIGMYSRGMTTSYIS